MSDKFTCFFTDDDGTPIKDWERPGISFDGRELVVQNVLSRCIIFNFFKGPMKIMTRGMDIHETLAISKPVGMETIPGIIYYDPSKTWDISKFKKEKRLSRRTRKLMKKYSCKGSRGIMELGGIV